MNLHKVPDGTFMAITSGCESSWKADGKYFEARFEQGVRGINIRDTIVVKDGEVSSQILGKAISVVSYRKED